MSATNHFRREEHEWATFRFNPNEPDNPEPYRSLVLERQRIQAIEDRIYLAKLNGGRKRRRVTDHAKKEFNLREEYFGFKAIKNLAGCILAEEVPAKCTPEEFHRNFRMSDYLFDKIHKDITDPVWGCNLFLGRPDAVGRVGPSSIQRMYSVLQQLAFGVCAFAVKDFSGVREELGRECLYAFYRFIIRRYGREYVGRWDTAAMEIEMAANEKRGFPGMIGSIDCCHWQWHRCPVAWQGQYQDRNHERSIVVEAVAGHDMYFHQAFVGLPGSLNDINILSRTDLQLKYMQSHAFKHEFKLDGEKWKGILHPFHPIQLYFVSSFQGDPLFFYSLLNIHF